MHGWSSEHLSRDALMPQRASVQVAQDHTASPPFSGGKGRIHIQNDVPQSVEMLSGMPLTCFFSWLRNAVLTFGFFCIK